MYNSSSSVRPSALLGYEWRPRWDLDVLQRCLGVAFLGLMAFWTLNSPLPSCLGLWVSDWFFQFWLTVALVLAVLKSAAQLGAKGKYVCVPYVKFYLVDTWDDLCRSVLITGCDTGFGLILARHLHSMGMTVFAGCLLKESGIAGAKELLELGSDRMHVLQLDVTKDEDWDTAFEYVEKVRRKRVQDDTIKY